MMMQMKLFLVLAWVALIATVSVSAQEQGLRGQQPEAMEEMGAVDEQQDERDLAYNGNSRRDWSGRGNVGYGSGYGTSGYSSSSYGSGYGSSGYGSSGYGSSGYGG